MLSYIGAAVALWVAVDIWILLLILPSHSGPDYR